MKKRIGWSTLLLLALWGGTAWGWHDATHMAVVQAAGWSDYAYLAVGPDIAKERTSRIKGGDIESPNHWYNALRGSVIDEQAVLDQVSEYNSPSQKPGRLYGAIVASVRKYRDLTADPDKYALYPLAYASHYLADLSQPFHNIAYDQYNQTNHRKNDGVVEGDRTERTAAKVERIAQGIRQRMERLPAVRLPEPKGDGTEFEAALAREVARVANGAIGLGYAMKDAEPQRSVMTEEEAYRQLAQSALLFRALLVALEIPLR